MTLGLYFLLGFLFAILVFDDPKTSRDLGSFPIHWRLTVFVLLIVFYFPLGIAGCCIAIFRGLKNLLIGKV